MQINKNRKGLALGAALSLFASLFVGAAPASANTDGQYIAVTPQAGPVANFNGTVYEDFPLTAYLLPGVTYGEFDDNKVIAEITKVSGNLDLLINTTATSSGGVAGAIADDARVASASPGADNVASISAAIEASKTNTFSVTVTAALVSSQLKLNFRAASSSAALNSNSPNVTFTVKVWIENPATANGKHDPLEWFTTRTVTLHNANSVPATTTLTAPIVGNSVVTVSSTVGALNFGNLGGTFALQVSSTLNNFEGDPDIAVTLSPEITAAQALARAGVVSFSFPITQSAGIASGTSISAFVVYDPAGSATVGATNSPSAGSFMLGNLAQSSVAGTATSAISMDVVSTSNAIQAGSTATVRANQTITYRVTATSNSGAVSVSGAVVSVAIVGTTNAALSLNVKEISVNGAASTTSYPTALSLTTGADGTATFTLTTTGFVGDEVLTITAKEQNVSDSLTVNVRGTVPTLTADYSQLAMAPGTTTPVVFSVKDQWGVSYAGSDLRIAVTKGGTGFAYSDTLSYVAVVAGKATFNFTPAPAAKTGSAVVTARLQQQQASTGTFINETNGADVVVSVNVSATADAFGAGLKASYSSDVSYFPNTVAAAVAVFGKVVNTGSAVVFSGPGLVFEDASGDTFSNTVTVRADGTLTYTANVYGTVAGSYTLTITNGSASTTSQFIVKAAAHDSGRSITFDTTAIEAGKTRIITGKVLDANGNPVATGNTASILVTFAGTAGIPVGAMPTQTNADGEFQVSILTSAADRGTFTLTATYLKSGATTATADRITEAQPITVGTAAAGSSSDQKLTVGSFKGFVAIYALNYAGQKLSAKVAGKWLVVEDLIRFQRVVRNTGAGYTIKVDLYIDGAFVRSETIVTK